MAQNKFDIGDDGLGFSTDFLIGILHLTMK